MATEKSQPYPVSDFLYERIYRVVSGIEEHGGRINMEFYLGAVDVAKAVFLTTGKLLSGKRVKNLLTSTSTFDFNQRLNKFPKKLFGL